VKLGDGRPARADQARGAAGQGEVRETFNVPKLGTIAGCMVLDGKITRKAFLRLFRANGADLRGQGGQPAPLQGRREGGRHGFECGIGIAGYNELQPGDVIEAFEVIEEAAKL
jgi:translation initiation factor IF-2